MDSEPNVLWEVSLGKPGLGGLAANEKYVFFGDRDLDDFQDVYRCLDADTGEIRWEVFQLAIGTLDYGNSPRATPLILDQAVVFFGAFGDLTCVDIESGETRWHVNLKSQFDAETELPWGYCGSPLLVDGKIIVNPGAAEASLAALNPTDGTVIWTTPGLPPSYGSLVATTLAGRRQIVGLDARTLGGWDIDSGERLWTVTPPLDSEFNVPTPLKVGDRLLVSTEQNGTRLYAIDDAGVPKEEPASQNIKLKPDMSSPVVIGRYLYCVNRFLYCLDVEDRLKELWRLRDPALSDYASIIASDDRLLVIGDSELLLLNANGEKRIISRQKVFDSSDRIYSHPALVGDKLFIRGESRLRCLKL